MGYIKQDIRGLGDLAATHELLWRGHTQMGLRNGVAEGLIVRVRTGWYSLPDLDPLSMQAARVGGRLTCVSAAVALGLWVPHHDTLELHVAVPARACQLRSRDDYRTRLSALTGGEVVVHWSDARREGNRLRVGIPAMIAHLAVCQDAEFTFVVAESALAKGWITRSEFDRILADLPSALRGLLKSADRNSGSGTESMFAYRMRRFGVRFRQQVQIGIDRVDFLLGDKQVVEIDSVAHHTLAENCARDARLGIASFRTLRFMGIQVEHDWPTVQRAVFAALSRGDHR